MRRRPSSTTCCAVVDPRVTRLPTFTKPSPVRERWRTARIGMTVAQLLSSGIKLSDVRYFGATGRMTFDAPVQFRTRKQLSPSKPRVVRERGTYKPAYLRPSDKLRRCLRCSAMFASQGPHNRLCDPCRARDVSPLAP